jgi:uncharacterized protein YndB with AHSA1/START domain
MRIPREEDPMSTETTVPPILRTVTVRRPVEEAFRIFTKEMGSWWPLNAYSRAYAERSNENVTSETLVFEGRVGGRLYEVMSDGVEAEWGQVLVWEPPHRVVIAWKPHPRPTPPTEVEVTFTAEDTGTRVDVEHRGWERLGDAATQAREEYVGGWPGVLGLFEQLANSQAT